MSRFRGSRIVTIALCAVVIVAMQVLSQTSQYSLALQAPQLSQAEQSSEPTPQGQAQRQPQPQVTQATQATQTHIVVAADKDFAVRYQPIFQKMQEYAAHHGYTWTTLDHPYFAERGGTPNACMHHQNFFFLKHCMVAAWMELEQFPSTDAVFVLDADVVPARFHIGLEHWTDHMKETVVFYIRAWSKEIMAGSYMVRNTIAGRDYLRGWAKYEFFQPPGFSSFDNGALHIHLLRSLGMEEFKKQGKCGRMYTRLQKSVNDLSDYWDYVHCSRETLVTDEHNKSENSTYSKGDFSLRLLPRKTGFVVDANHDDMERLYQHGPVFHHGVKFNRDQSIEQRHWIRYNLTLPEGFWIREKSVSCGNNKRANTCGECPGAENPSTCNGDCTWCPKNAQGWKHLPPVMLNVNVTHQCTRASSCIDDELDKDKESHEHGQVSCGGHRANTCGECGPQHMCNGECHWCPGGIVMATQKDQCVGKARQCTPLGNFV